jgi:hypothetical protein
MDYAKQVGYEQNDQYRAEADSSAATVTPSAVAIISAAAGQHQQQDNKQDQHVNCSFF